MRTAVVQLEYGDEETVEERTARVADLVREQAGHDLVVLPELWPAGGFDYGHWDSRAEPVDGPVAQAMASAARDAGVLLHAGSIVERLPQGGVDGHSLANTSLVFTPTGELAAAYRKIHRFGFGAGEPALMEAGEHLVLLDLPEGYQAGLSTCYDLRFPELYRAQLDAGATVFIIPAAWPAVRVSHWSLLGRARAVEDQCVVIACNTAGTHASTQMGGHSQVVLPTGEVLAEAGATEQVLSVDIELGVVPVVREEFPVLRDRRL